MALLPKQTLAVAKRPSCVPDYFNIFVVTETNGAKRKHSCTHVTYRYQLSLEALIAFLQKSTVNVKALKGQNIQIHIMDGLLQKVREFQVQNFPTWIFNESSNCPFSAGWLGPSVLGLPLPNLPDNFFSFDFNLTTLDNASEPWTFIIGESGSGKSVFLKWIARYLIQNKLVVYLDLSNIPIGISGIQPFQTTTELIEKIIQLLLPRKDTAEAILEKLYRYKNHCVFLLDGVDEICDDLAETVNELLFRLSDFAKKMKANIYLAVEDASILRQTFTSSNIIDVSKIINLENQKSKAHVRIPMLTEALCGKPPNASTCLPLYNDMTNFIKEQFPELLPINDMSEASLLESLTLALTYRMLKNETPPEGQHHIDRVTLLKMNNCMKMAHLSKALRQFSGDFCTITSITDQTYLGLTDNDFLNYGLMIKTEVNGNSSLKFKHRSYSDYIISEYLCTIATSPRISRLSEYRAEVAELFILFVCQSSRTDMRLTDKISFTNHMPTESKVMRNKVMNSLLSGKRVNHDFLEMVSRQLESHIMDDSRMKKILTHLIQILITCSQLQLLHLILQVFSKTSDRSRHVCDKIVLEAEQYARQYGYNKNL